MKINVKQSLKGKNNNIIESISDEIYNADMLTKIVNLKHNDFIAIKNQCKQRISHNQVVDTNKFKRLYDTLEIISHGNDRTVITLINSNELEKLAATWQ